MIVSCQIVRSSLRQLSMVSVTFSAGAAGAAVGSGALVGSAAAGAWVGWACAGACAGAQLTNRHGQHDHQS